MNTQINSRSCAIAKAIARPLFPLLALFATSNFAIADSAPIAPSGSLVQVENGTWGGLPVESGYVDTGAGLGWLYVGLEPWIWALNHDKWLYIPEPSPEDHGFWIFMPVKGVVDPGDPSDPVEAAAPFFTPDEGSYIGAVDVTLATETSGATIRYTIDGATPSSTVGEIYDGPITISTTTTLKAIAYGDGLLESDIVSATYTIQEPGAAPVRVASFGPNGTHWPAVVPTPFIYDDEIPNIIEVECSWSGIKSALASVTEEQAAEGVLILVQPGNLVGNGSGSTRKPVLQDLGSLDWEKRVTVAPRDGFGSVTISEGARIFQVFSVCFAGFDADSIAFHANSRSALAWTRVTDFLSVNGTTGAIVRDVEIVEVVIPDAGIGNADSADCYSAGALETSNYVFDGVYMAPRYRPAGGSGHTDTIQFAETSSGSLLKDILIRDSAFFASSNCAIQVGSIDGLVVEHTYVVGGAPAKTRYPFPEGADTSGANNCFNGSGRDGGRGLEAYDCYFVGGINGHNGGWLRAENTYTVYDGDNVPVEGAWIVDKTLNENNPPMPPYPSTEYLQSIWGPPVL